jgi:hypothetical protein
MSQRRQDARRAQQERRRQERRNARVEARRTALSQAPPGTRPRVAVPVRPARNRRIWWIVGSSLVAALIIAGIVFLVIQQRQPLPGTKYPTNGNQHVTLGEPHGAYFSNPPTSGWHLDPIPNPGIYSQPKKPEELGHFMEHGGVWVLYTCPDGCPDLVQQLTDVVNSETARNKPVALAPYPPPGYPLPDHKISLISWQWLEGLDSFDKNKIETFIERHNCQYNPEGPGWCGQVKGKLAPEAVDAGASGFNAVTATPAPAGSATPAAPAAATAAPAPSGVGPTPPPAASATPSR